MALRDELRPVGTRQEVLSIGGDPGRVPTCSLATKGNKGCTYFVKGKCPARRLRDAGLPLGSSEGQGPFNGVMYVQLSDEEAAHAANHEMACYEMHQTGLWDRMKQTEETGEIIIIRGWEGDKREFEFREATHEAHRKANPDCQQCKSTKIPCFAIEETTVRKQITPFKRPANAFKSEARGANIREEMFEQHQQAANEAAMERMKPQTLEPIVPPKEPDGQGAQA